MLTCQQLTELVTEYLEGNLSFGQRLSFQFHVGMCRSCRSYLRQMRLPTTVLGHVPPIEIPDGVRAELLARFQGWHGGSSSTPAPP